MMMIEDKYLSAIKLIFSIASFGVPYKGIRGSICKNY